MGNASQLWSRLASPRVYKVYLRNKNWEETLWFSERNPLAKRAFPHMSSIWRLIFKTSRRVTNPKMGSPMYSWKHLHWSNRLQDSFKIWFPWSHSQTVKRIWLITITFHQATKYVHSGPCPIWTSAVADPDSVGPPKIYRGLLRIRSVNRSQYFFNKYPHLNISIQAWCSVEDSNSTMIPHVWAYPGLEGILRHSQGKLKI